MNKHICTCIYIERCMLKKFALIHVQSIKTLDTIDLGKTISSLCRVPNKVRFPWQAQTLCFIIMQITQHWKHSSRSNFADLFLLLFFVRVCVRVCVKKRYQKRRKGSKNPYYDAYAFQRELNHYPSQAVEYCSQCLLSHFLQIRLLCPMPAWKILWFCFLFFFSE